MQSPFRIIVDAIHRKRRGRPREQRGQKVARATYNVLPFSLAPRLFALDAHHLCLAVVHCADRNRRRPRERRGQKGCARRLTFSFYACLANLFASTLARSIAPTPIFEASQTTIDPDDMVFIRRAATQRSRISQSRRPFVQFHFRLGCATSQTTLESAASSGAQ